MDQNSFPPDNIPDDIEGGPYRPTEEDFYPSPRRRPIPLDMYPNWGSFFRVMRLYMLMVIVSVAYWRGLVPHFAASGAQAFGEGQYWCLFTALFTHANFGHLLSNTPLLLIFGTFLRFHFGWLAFPVLPLLVGVLSNAATVAIYPPTARLVGASGMIYGMVALWLVWYVKYDTSRPVTVRIFRAVAFSLVVMFPTTFHKTTSYLAHALGFGMGLGLAFLTIPFVKPQAQVPDPEYGIT